MKDIQCLEILLQSYGLVFNIKTKETMVPNQLGISFTKNINIPGDLTLEKWAPLFSFLKCYTFQKLYLHFQRDKEKMKCNTLQHACKTFHNSENIWIYTPIYTKYYPNFAFFFEFTIKFQCLELKFILSLWAIQPLVPSPPGSVLHGFFPVSPSLRGLFPSQGKWKRTEWIWEKGRWEEGTRRSAGRGNWLGCNL